jgi:hypothetical protein
VLVCAGARRSRAIYGALTRNSTRAPYTTPAACGADTLRTRRQAWPRWRSPRPLRAPPSWTTWATCVPRAAVACAAGRRDAETAYAHAHATALLRAPQRAHLLRLAAQEDRSRTRLPGECAFGEAAAVQRALRVCLRVPRR